MVGMMTTQQVPLVQIDGKSQRLAPGARIVGANNASITPNQVPANSKVRYRVDASGQVTHVWLLPPESSLRPPAASRLHCFSNKP